MAEFGFLRDLLVLFGLGVVVVLLFLRVKVPPIVGFLFTGVVCGPYGFGLIRNVHEVEALADIGVVLLLFTVGIEFSVQKLVRIRGFLIGGGLMQVGGTIALVAGLAHLAGQPWPVAVFLGMVVSLSSTAIVLRLLSERGEIDSPHGGAVLAILIFQDLCIVPMVLLTPFLAGNVAELGSLPLVAAKAVAFVTGAVLAARYVVPWVLKQVVAARQREIFLLTVILIGLGAAWESAAIGLSLALGAFIAGLVISESEYSHQALGEILPLREVFNSLFFVSIGMLFDVRTLVERPEVIAAAVAAVILVKTSAAAGVAFVFGRPIRVAIIAGLTLAQIGEFSFVLSKVGLSVGLLDERLNQLFLAVAVVTMALTPVAIALGPGFALWVDLRIPGKLHRSPRIPVEAPGDDLEGLHDHVIIVGYGLNGRNLARVLQRSEIPFVVIELNPETVRAERKRGRRILFGDFTREEIMQLAGIERARVLVLAISDAASTRNAVVLARRLNPAVHIVVRSRYMMEMEPLLELGTDEVVSEEFETSIEIFARVLRRYLVPRDVIERMIQNIRQTGYEAMRSVAEAQIPTGTLGRFVSGLTVDVVRVEPGSSMDGTRLADSGLREQTGASVVGLQRASGERLANPAGPDVLQPDDIVLLIGRHDQLTEAVRRFSATDSEETEALTPEAARLSEQVRASS